MKRRRESERKFKGEGWGRAWEGGEKMEWGRRGGVKAC